MRLGDSCFTSPQALFKFSGRRVAVGATSFRPDEAGCNCALSGAPPDRAYGVLALLALIAIVGVVEAAPNSKQIRTDT